MVSTSAAHRFRTFVGRRADQVMAFLLTRVGANVKGQRRGFRDCPKLSTRWIVGPLMAQVFYAVVSKIVTKGRFGPG